MSGNCYCNYVVVNIVCKAQFTNINNKAHFNVYSSSMYNFTMNEEAEISLKKYF